MLSYPFSLFFSLIQIFPHMCRYPNSCHSSISAIFSLFFNVLRANHCDICAYGRNRDKIMEKDTEERNKTFGICFIFRYFSIFWQHQILLRSPNMPLFLLYLPFYPLIYTALIYFLSLYMIFEIVDAYHI